MKQINNWNEAEGSITVTLFKNPFKKEGFYGRVKRRTIKLDTIIGMIAQKNPGISEGLMQIVAGYMQKEILNLIGLGYCVNILELGTMYIAPKGSIDGAETNGISEVEARFTPSDVLNAKVDEIFDGTYGVQIQCSGVDHQRLTEISYALAGYCPERDSKEWFNEIEDDGPNMSM